MCPVCGKIFKPSFHHRVYCCYEHAHKHSQYRRTSGRYASDDVEAIVMLGKCYLRHTFATRLLCRKVDLVMADAVENPYFQADVDRTRQLIYAA